MDEDQFAQFTQIIKDVLAASSTLKNSGESATSAQMLGSHFIINFKAFYKQEENFKQYCERFENYSTIKRISENADVKKNTFLNCIGPETYKIAKAIVAPATLEDLTYVQMVAKHVQSQICW